MNPCAKYKRAILLYHYDELNDEERKQLERHLQSCTHCMNRLKELQKLGELLPRHPIIEPDEFQFQSLRRRVITRFLSQNSSKERNRTFSSFFPFIVPKPAFQVGFMILLLVIGFFLGRSVNSPHEKAVPLIHVPFLTREGGEGLQNKVIPYGIQVEDVRLNSDEQKVDLQLAMMMEVRLSGNTNNPLMTELLHQALIDNANPAVRLHAVKALRTAIGESDQLHDEMLHTIAYVIREDTILGIRLQALRCLDRFYADNRIYPLLLRVLVSDESPAMRILAFDILQNSRSKEPDIPPYLAIAARDTNSYLKYFANALLKEVRSPYGIHSESTDRKE